MHRWLFHAGHRVQQWIERSWKSLARLRDRDRTDIVSGNDVVASFALERRSASDHCLCYIEFIGGPLDGYLEGLPIPPEELVATIAIPVCPLTAKTANGDKPTSVAFYELDIEQPIPPRYLFMGASRPRDIDKAGIKF